MVVVDTSVWVDYFKGRQTAECDLLHRLLAEQPVLMGDLILAELLQGASSEVEARRMLRALDPLVFRPMVGKAVALEAAWHYRKLRGQGVTVRKTIDVLIGTFCILGGHTLLHSDRDFDPLESRLGLKCLRD